ncbi:Golgi transport complex subunit 1 [Linnemannia zychae]|nr:Golgi transport complex subunit 1 [Linnemannia zychae]
MDMDVEMDVDLDVGFDLSMTKDDLLLSTLTPSPSCTSLYQLYQDRRCMTTTITTTTTTTTVTTNSAPSSPVAPIPASNTLSAHSQRDDSDLITANRRNSTCHSYNNNERSSSETLSVSMPDLGLVSEGPYLFVFDMAVSLYFPIRAMILFVLGFVFSLVIDHLQTQHHLIQYPTQTAAFSNMYRLWDTASWLPPTCGAAAVLIGTIYPLGDYLWWGQRVNRNHRDWSSVMRCFGGFIGVNYAASKLPWTSSLQVSCTLALISVGLWFWFDRTFHGFVISLIVASAGTLVAYFLVANGWYSFTRADVFGVGSWIPCILYSSSVCFGSIGRQLDVVPEAWSRKDSCINSHHYKYITYTDPGAMAATMANNSSSATSKPPVDADELFMKLSVPELNVYERRTRQDIENKKQELRMMVGERYRDLIGAADCIVRMKETALSVQDNIARMRSSCDIHSLKRNVAAKTKKAQSGAMDDMKKSLYTSAAQIKLLADVPEQIWRNMENHSYLTASRLYLISKAIYKNLNADAVEASSQSVKVMETFPVVGRQWDAVSHFKTQILQKSHAHLKNADKSDLDVIETMCAVMLLDDMTMKDMFALLLTQRREAIREALEVQPQQQGASGGSDVIAGQIVKAIEILKATLFHVSGVFLEPGESSLAAVSPLERHLRSLQQNFSTPPPIAASNDGYLAMDGSVATLPDASSSILQPAAQINSTMTTASSVIPKLYPTTPNIHLLVRYLPESVQNFTPFIHLEGSRAVFSQQDVIQGVKTWVEDVSKVFGGGFETLLQQVHTNAALVAIRASVWGSLQVDEFAGLSSMNRDLSSSGVKKRRANAWKGVCQTLLGEPFSIWDRILRAGFTKTFQDIIVFSLEDLSLQPERLLRPRLGELDREEDPNHDVGKFIWNDTAVTKGAILPTATEPLIQRIREYVDGKTDLVAQATGAFESKLIAIREDQEKALVLDREALLGQLLVETSGDDGLEEDEIEELDRDGGLWDLFGARRDTRELVEFYQRQTVECIKAYTLGLKKLVVEAVRKPEKARNTVQAMDRAMTVGRVASGVAAMGWTLQRLLAPPRDRSSSLNFAQARASQASVDAQVQDLLQGLGGVYLTAHEAWIESVEWLLTRGVRHYLRDSSWTDLATLAWEPMTSATSASATSSPMGSGRRGSPLVSSGLGSSGAGSGAKAGDEAKTLLPFHGSTRIVTALHQVVQEMHRIGTGFMKPELIEKLTVKLALVTFRALDTFLNDVVVDGSTELTPEEAENKVVLSEKGALQLLFDAKFLGLVFSTAVEKDVELGVVQKTVLNRIRGFIDPINLATFEKPLDVNAERQYSRVAVLLGLLVQLNPVDSKRKMNVIEQSPHVFAMAPLTARFTLLPIGQRMTGRVV